MPVLAGLILGFVSPACSACSAFGWLCWLYIILAGLLTCCLDWLLYNYNNPNPDYEMLILGINADPGYKC
jgi:hypothetical protein